jgi:hypothetical protein
MKEGWSFQSNLLELHGNTAVGGHSGSLGTYKKNSKAGLLGRDEETDT